MTAHSYVLAIALASIMSLTASGQWSVSVNPAGILELPAAAPGFGVGYRINKTSEIWTESSFLYPGIATVVYDVKGFRQVLQYKHWIDTRRDIFMAAEVRYKYVSFKDSGYFSAPGRDSLMNRNFGDNTYAWGAAIQIGKRKNLTRDGRLQYEMTIGLGIKFKKIGWTGIPNDYKWHSRSIDLSAWDFIYHRGVSAYFPGSIRLIYSFGKLHDENTILRHSGIL